VEDTNISDSDALTDDKVEINLNMLGALMLYDVVTVDQGCRATGGCVAPEATDRANKSRPRY
jgi:hypothetical protein